MHARSELALLQSLGSALTPVAAGAFSRGGRWRCGIVLSLNGRIKAIDLLQGVGVDAILALLHIHSLAWRVVKTHTDSL